VPVLANRGQPPREPARRAAPALHYRSLVPRAGAPGARQSPRHRGRPRTPADAPPLRSGLSPKEPISLVLKARSFRPGTCLARELNAYPESSAALEVTSDPAVSSRGDAGGSGLTLLRARTWNHLVAEAPSLTGWPSLSSMVMTESPISSSTWYSVGQVQGSGV
jgi:hypothetical protein